MCLSTVLRKIVIICLSVLALSISTTILADDGFVDLSFSVNQRNYYSKSIKKTMDIAPFINEGSTLVPFRTIFEELGFQVAWDAETSTVTATGNNSVIRLQINNKISNVNGQDKTLAVAPQVYDGRTVVPLRFVSENAGANVAWESTTKSIYITKVGKYDTGTAIFVEKAPGKNKIYVYDGNEMKVLALGSKDIVNMKAYKGKVLMTVYDNEKKTNSFMIFRNGTLENLIQNFDFKESLEFNDNLLIHGYDRSQKADKLCRFDGEEVHVIEENFYVGKVYEFKDKLIINKYNNKRDYTLLAFNKSSWTPGILKEGFIIKDAINDDENLYITGSWQEGKKKPLYMYDGNGITEDSFKKIYDDISIDLNNTFMFNGKLHTLLGSNLVSIESDAVKNIIFKKGSNSRKYGFSAMTIFKGDLFLGINSVSLYDSSYKIANKPKNFKMESYVIKLNGDYDFKEVNIKDVKTIEANEGSYEFITDTNDSKLPVSELMVSKFEVENEKLLMLGTESDSDSAMYIYDGSSFAKAVDVNRINNSVSIGQKSFIDVVDKNRITGQSRNTMILYKDNALTNLVVGMDTKQLDTINDSLIFSGYEPDIKKSKIYTYSDSFNELMNDFNVVYWNKNVDDELLICGTDNNVKKTNLYKFKGEKLENVRENFKILNMINAKGKYMFVDATELNPDSINKNKKILYIYDKESNTFIEMKVNHKFSEMLYVD